VIIEAAWIRNKAGASSTTKHVFPEGCGTGNDAAFARGFSISAWGSVMPNVDSDDHIQNVDPMIM
jgi:hypothetical protein